MQPWLIREPFKDDISFIYATWLNSLYTDSWMRSIRKSVYFDNYKKVLDRILLRAKITIACKPDDPTVIFGYLISEPGIVHYSFVKDAFRKLGVAKSLYKHVFPNGEKPEITHKTRCLDYILTTHENEYMFNPILLFNKEPF